MSQETNRRVYYVNEVTGYKGFRSVTTWSTIDKGATYLFIHKNRKTGVRNIAMKRLIDMWAVNRLLEDPSYKLVGKITELDIGVRDVAIAKYRKAYTAFPPNPKSEKGLALKQAKRDALTAARAAEGLNTVFTRPVS